MIVFPIVRYNKTTFYLVFDFAEHDLAGLLSNVNVKFSLGERFIYLFLIVHGAQYYWSVFFRRDQESDATDV